LGCCCKKTKARYLSLTLSNFGIQAKSRFEFTFSIASEAATPKAYL
jgi:hypothetical protein